VRTAIPSKLPIDPPPGPAPPAPRRRGNNNNNKVTQVHTHLKYTCGVQIFPPERGGGAEIFDFMAAKVVVKLRMNPTTAPPHKGKHI
jgi:hypothetical protein